MHLLPISILASTAEATEAAGDPGVYGTLIPLIIALPLAGFVFTPSSAAGSRRRSAAPWRSSSRWAW